MSDVFITYAREDYERARTLAGLLEKAGWSVWWDRKIPLSRPFDVVIEEALDSARCVVVLWSRAAVTSDWVRAEAAEGKARNVLVPVLLEDVRIPLEFRRIQAARLLKWTGSVPGPDFDRLHTSLTQILGEPTPPSHEVARHAHSAVLDQARSRPFWTNASALRSKPRLLLGLFAGLAIIAVILVVFQIRAPWVGVSSPPLNSGSATRADDGQDAGVTLQTEPLDLSELVGYKIDVYFDQDYEVDRVVAARIKDLLTREAHGTTVILAPRQLGFVTSVVPPASYEVRYDAPSEREPALVLVRLLNQHDSSWQVSAIRSWSQTHGVLSILLFSRAHSESKGRGQ